MRKILKLLPLALALAACSSMEPKDDFELYGDFLPPDFNLANFSRLNPDIAVLQAIDTIRQINEAWENLQKETLTATEINALKKSDSTAFVDGEGQTVARNYLKWRDEDIAAALNEARSNDTTARGRWLRFNIYGQDNEPSFLEGFLQSKVDSTLILQTYTMYGRKDGRPYRVCKSGELANEVKSREMAGVIVIQSGAVSNPTYSYDYSEIFLCDDDGVVRRATDFSNN